MRGRSMAALAAWLAAPAILLGACAAPDGAGAWRAPPRTGVGIPVDPVYGTPAPGSPPIF